MHEHYYIFDDNNEYLRKLLISEYKKYHPQARENPVIFGCSAFANPQLYISMSVYSESIYIHKPQLMDKICNGHDCNLQVRLG